MSTATNLQRAHLDCLRWLDEHLASTDGFDAVADRAVRHLRATFPAYHWVGIYMLDGDALSLAAWDGPAPTEHVRIPLDQGVCGWAASTGTLLNVPDVNDDPRYLQCFLGTRSEIVVPIAVDGRVFGEIDIDSDTLAAFGPEDEAFLASYAERLAARAAEEGLPAHVPAAGG